MQRILPGLFIGDYQSSIDEDLLMKNNISHILIAAAYIPPRFPKVFVVP